MGFPLATNDKTANSEERDQTARMCRLILLDTVCKMNSWLRTAGQEIKKWHVIVKGKTNERIDRRLFTCVDY